RNGDLLSGSILTSRLVINTGYADITVDLEEIAKIENSGTDKIVTRITLVNGDVLQGELKEDDLRIWLDVGLTLDIYKDRIMAIKLNRRVSPSAKDQDEVAREQTKPAEEVVSQGENDKPTESDGTD
ncbi:MAG: hypothetical protein ACE5JO_09440, partial [Candidatus Binatia bacterium]